VTATADRAPAQPQIDLPVLEFDDVELSFAGVKAIDGVSFTVGGNELFAIIGPNGAGKTSIFNVLSGVYRPQSGRVTFAGTEHRAVLQPDGVGQPHARPSPPQHLRRAVLVRLAR
jgi:branched-chain amino acid transport system ATP-binding protein